MGGLLADSRGRAAAARAVAGHLGTGTFLILVWDDAVTSLRPAPGFPATLPGGRSWRTLLDRCACETGSFAHELAAAGGRAEPASIYVAPDRTVVVFIGGNPRVAPREFAEANPLLLALLKSECREGVAAGLARSAQDAHRTAHALTLALDGTRRSLATGGLALKAALAEAARLNKDLQSLNATLEDRVREETAERLKAQDALRQAQKMEAIGQLTGGVAHDFNNLLTVIMGGLDAIARQIAGGTERVNWSRLQRSQEMATLGAQRAATLTARLLAFSRRQALDPKPVEVNGLIRNMTEMLQRTLGETVALETVSTPGLWRAQVDASELEHAVLNLAVNARDAMPDGGKLTIETANVFLDEVYLKDVTEPVPPGQYVMTAVSDTGHGMHPQTIERVFEPFFTTKEAGKGTGLGLSQVYGFVRQSGGHVRIYSEIGQGTSIKLYLPRAHGPLAEAESTSSDNAKAVLRGDETVLVVEDDASVRQYSTSVLRELGYLVLEAESGLTALKLLRANQPIDLLFTDVILPCMNGRQLADEARKLQPQLPVLFTSGYSRNAIIHNGRLEAGLNLLMKPFTFQQLAEKVRTVLDDVSQGGK